jgi:hypothetical protein
MTKTPLIVSGYVSRSNGHLRQNEGEIFLDVGRMGSRQENSLVQRQEKQFLRYGKC